MCLKTEFVQSCRRLQTFSIIHQKTDASNEECALNYCACNKCFKIYQLKNNTGRPLSMTSLIKHSCHVLQAASDPAMLEPETNSICIRLDTIQAEGDEYCFEGHFDSRNIKGCIWCKRVDLEARYGRTDVKFMAFKKKAIANEATSMATKLMGTIHDHLQLPIKDGAVSLCTGMFTNDFRKQSYVNVHASWIYVDFNMQHTALAIRNVGMVGQTDNNIKPYKKFLKNIPYRLTTDRGSTPVAALKNNIRTDCAYHRLHTMLNTSWKDTKNDMPAAD